MTSFVFLTATDDGGLSPRATKQMRAHITRTNFAKRRERLAKSAATETLSPSGAQITEDKRGSNVLGQERRAVLLRPLISRTYPLPIHLLTVAQAGDSLCSAQTR